MSTTSDNEWCESYFNDIMGKNNVVTGNHEIKTQSRDNYEKYFKKTYKHKRESIRDYLMQTMECKKVIFDKKYLNCEIENELFSLTFNPCYGTNKVTFKYHRKPHNINIMEHLLEIDYNGHFNSIYHRKNEDQYDKEGKEEHYFITNGLTPIRYLFMIKDFFWKDIRIEDCERSIKETLDMLDYTPDRVLYNIIKLKNSEILRKEHAFLKVLHPEWETQDMRFNELSKHVLYKSSNYLSIRNSKKGNYNEHYKHLEHQGYGVFAAAEGGICFRSDFQLINNRFYMSNGLRCYNYAKGSTTYTNKHNNVEELYCLYLMLKDNEIPVEIKINI